MNLIEDCHGTLHIVHPERERKRTTVHAMCHEILVGKVGQMFHVNGMWAFDIDKQRCESCYLKYKIMFSDRRCGV